MRQKLKTLFFALLLAGALLIVIGAYLCVVKAGIPYQDPTPEMQLRYYSFLLAGEYNLKCGAVAALCGLAGYLICRLKRTGKEK